MFKIIVTKVKKTRKYILFMMILSLIACSTEDDWNNSGNIQPEIDKVVELACKLSTYRTDGMTRTVAGMDDKTWRADSTEHIEVLLYYKLGTENLIDSGDYFIINKETGNASPYKSILWPNENVTAKICACLRPDSSLSTIKVSNDTFFINIINQSDGFRQFDLIRTNDTVSLSYQTSANLLFNHMMAKLVIELPDSAKNYDYATAQVFADTLVMWKHGVMWADTARGYVWGCRDTSALNRFEMLLPPQRLKSDGYLYFHFNFNIYRMHLPEIQLEAGKVDTLRISIRPED